MAEVFIAAAPDADAQAGGLAQALKSLGFDAAAGAPAEAEIATLVDDAKCVIGLWSRGAPTAELAMLAALAHERKKLVSAELAALIPASLHHASAPGAWVRSGGGGPGSALRDQRLEERPVIE